MLGDKNSDTENTESLSACLKYYWHKIEEKKKIYILVCNLRFIRFNKKLPFHIVLESRVSIVSIGIKHTNLQTDKLI